MSARGVALWVGLCIGGCHGSKATPSGSALRVVSLSPSTTEALAAVGATGDIVGRSRYCDYPPEVLHLPVVGGFTDPNFEAIVALQPTLVTGARGPSGPQITERLTALGIATYFPPTETLEEIDRMIVGLGERTGHAAQARALVDGVHAREESVRVRTMDGGHPRTLLVFGLSPIVVAGPASFAAEMLRGAGGDNVVTEGGAYPTVGMERVLALAPEVIVDASMQESRGEERITKDSPGWRELAAVREGRVVPLRDEAVLRPGPRVGEGMATLARAIHPEIVLP